MSADPILLIGGSGAVGRHASRFLRAADPDAPLLIGGRDLAVAAEVAAGIGNAEGVAIDLADGDLGLGARAVRAVAVLLRDEARAGLRFAQARGAPYVAISTGIDEIAPEVATFMRDPARAAIVLGTEWLVGATTIPTLAIARRFARVDDVTIGALLDDEDLGGPAQVADLRGLTEARPPALTLRNGRYVWRSGDDADARFRAADGAEMAAIAMSTLDVVALASATGARSVAMNLATGVSSSRRRGAPMSTEIVIEIAGEDAAGRPLRTRHAVVHPEGQFPLTGLGVALVLERLVGLDGRPAAPAGLYFPSQLIDGASYDARLDAIGGAVLALEPGAG